MVLAGSIRLADGDLAARMCSHVWSHVEPEIFVPRLCPKGVRMQIHENPNFKAIRENPKGLLYFIYFIC